MREIKFRAWDTTEKRMILDVQKDGLAVYLALKSQKVMQYTGLKDKNGKEIYEGDIINTDDYDKQTFNFPEDYEWLEMKAQNPSEIEVIGNIYENKELLNDQ